MSRIAIFCDTFDPPGVHHLDIIEDVGKLGFRTIIYPRKCSRPGTLVDCLTPQQRVYLLQAGFGFPERNWSYSIDYSDLTRGVFSPTCQLQERFQSKGEIWHIFEAEWFVGASTGESCFHKFMIRGREVWNHCGLIVIPREEHPLAQEDLPSNHLLLPYYIEGSSAEIRARVARGESIAGLVDPKVEKYILENGLYLPKGG